MSVSEKLVDNLLNTHMFYGVNKQAVIKLFEEYPPDEVIYKNGDTIYSRDSYRLAMGFIVKGAVQVTKKESGVILSKLREKDIFGCAALFSTNDYYVNDLIAVKETKVIFIDKSTVIKLMAIDSCFSMNFIKYLSDRLYYLNSRIVSFTGGTAESRLANFLLSSFGDYKFFELDRSLSQLAVSLDIGRASLYRAFDKLVENGAIEREGKIIRLLNEEVLKSYLPQ